MLQCVRGGCGGEVKAGLGYDIRAQRAWVYDLAASAGASGSVAPDGAMALCEKHADSANVPQGWELVDSRTSTTGPVSAPTAEPAVSSAPTEPAVSSAPTASAAPPPPSPPPVPPRTASVIAPAPPPPSPPPVPPRTASVIAPAPPSGPAPEPPSAERAPDERASGGFASDERAPDETMSVPSEDYYNQELDAGDQEMNQEETHETPLLERAFRAVPQRDF